MISVGEDFEGRTNESIAEEGASRKPAGKIRAADRHKSAEHNTIAVAAGVIDIVPSRDRVAEPARRKRAADNLRFPLSLSRVRRAALPSSCDKTEMRGAS